MKNVSVSLTIEKDESAPDDNGPDVVCLNFDGRMLAIPIGAFNRLLAMPGGEETVEGVYDDVFQER